MSADEVTRLSAVIDSFITTANSKSMAGRMVPLTGLVSLRLLIASLCPIVQYVYLMMMLNVKFTDTDTFSLVEFFDAQTILPDGSVAAGEPLNADMSETRVVPLASVGEVVGMFKYFLSPTSSVPLLLVKNAYVHKKGLEDLAQCIQHIVSYRRAEQTS